MARGTRLPLVLLVLALLLDSGRRAQGEGYEARLKPGHCPCAKGQGCWHYLRSPLRPPADRCRCGCCLSGGDCSTRPRPEGVSAACWNDGSEACFWKRHALSWRIQCSECWSEERCGACDPAIGGRDPKVFEILERQRALEGHDARRPLVVVVSPHFYVVTDLDRRLRVPVDGGAPRLASAHEVAHLYAQRAEQAYEDFLHHFGPPVILGKPMAVYLVDKNARKEGIQAGYMGSPRTNMIYGGGSNRIAGGFAGNGFACSLQDLRNDTSLHAHVRHMIGHILFSCWVVVSGRQEECPTWAFSGAAHFLQKLLPEHVDEASFCSNETAAPTGSGRDWAKRARALAAGRLDPIETFFGRRSLGAFSYDDRVRAWSIMDLLLKEDGERWREALRGVRRAEGEGAAFKAALGYPPDELQRRWQDRLGGRRPTMGETRKDADQDPEAPGARERRRLAETQEPEVLAGLVRGLDRVRDARTAGVVLGRFDHPSDLVRETLHLVLSASTDPEVVRVLREEGLAHRSPMVRAGIARVLGSQRDAASREALEGLLGDRHWLARANAASALARIGDEASLPPLVRAMEERAPKPWIALSDALATFGKPSAEATAFAARRLGDAEWQVRVTAARGLAAYGTLEAVDPLIDRYALEGGRVQRELLRALRAVTRDDLGENPETWRTWWKRQKELHGGIPPEPPGAPPVTDDRYAPSKKPPEPGDPHYYGRRIFSKSVGFVLDTSKSMEASIRVPEQAAQRLGQIPLAGTRAQIAKGVLGEAIRRLDPRVRFQLVFFDTDVRMWRRGGLVPATPANAASAASAVQNASLQGETNIHGALKAILGLADKASSLDATLDPIPDTVYFLSDGAPNRGEIVATPELLSWFEDLNRFAKVELHVVALGNLGVDLPFLGRLAAIGGGEFLHVPEDG